MQPINDNLIVIEPGDPLQGIDDCLKIYLSGSMDVSGNMPWQQKFINALAKMTVPHPENPEVPDYSMFKFAIINPTCPVNGEPTLDNPEFVQKTQWMIQCQGEADVIFCNLLRKSTNISAILDYFVWAQSGKLVARIPGDNIFYPRAKMISEAFGVPLLGDSGSVIQVFEAIFGSIPKFAELQQFGLQ